MQDVTDTPHAAPATPQPDEPRAPRAKDVRGETTATQDRSAHRRYTWLYDDLLA